MSDLFRIAIIGKGNVGSNLGIHLTGLGFHIKFGVREGSEVLRVLSRCHGRAEALPVNEAIEWSDIVFLAIPYASVKDVLPAFKGTKGKVIVDCTNPITWEDGPVWNPPKEGSVAAMIAAELPNVRVVKGFNTFGAEFMRDPSVGSMPVDVLIAGDEDARRTIEEFAIAAKFNPIDAGPLRNAATLENMGILWIHLATIGGFGRTHAFRFVDRSEHRSVSI